MPGIARKIEVVANVAIILVALLLAYVVVTLFFLRQEPTIPQIANGTKLAVEGVHFDDSRQTVLLALSVGCHFCSESAPFYRRLLDEASKRPDVRIVAVLPQERGEAQKYLDSLSVPIKDIRQAPLSTIQVGGTPTLIMLDAKGEVTASWIGKLPPEQETEVLSKLPPVTQSSASTPSAGTPSALAAAAGQAESPDAARRSLTRAFERLATAYPYRSTDTSSVILPVGPSMSPTMQIVEYGARDRLRIRWTDGATKSEVISLGDRIYVNADGQWQATPVTEKMKADMLRARTQPDEVQDVQWVGMETVDGAAMRVYRFRYSSSAFKLKITGDGRAWIGAADDRLRRMETEASLAGFQMKSRMLYEYDVTIRIEPPAI